MLKIAFLTTVVLFSHLMAEERPMTPLPVAKKEIQAEVDTDEIRIQKARVNLGSVKILHKAEDNDFTAYVYQDNANLEHVLYQDKSTRTLYEIANLPMPHRYFSDLVFTAPGILNFNRWSSPHYGLHYEFDLHRRVLLVTEAITDSVHKDIENTTDEHIDPALKSWLGTYTYRESGANVTMTRSFVFTYCIDVRYDHGVGYANQYSFENSDMRGTGQRWNVQASNNKIIFTYNGCIMPENNSPCRENIPSGTKMLEMKRIKNNSQEFEPVWHGLQPFFYNSYNSKKRASRINFEKDDSSLCSKLIGLTNLH